MLRSEVALVHFWEVRSGCATRKMGSAPFKICTVRSDPPGTVPTCVPGASSAQRLCRYGWITTLGYNSVIAATSYLYRLLEPLTQALTPKMASALLALRADPEMEAYIDELRRREMPERLHGRKIRSTRISLRPSM
jgi:hypothetical protein